MCDPIGQAVSTSSLNLSSAVSVRVLRKALDAQEQQGSQIVEMIKDAAAMPAVDDDGHVDVYA
jgi:hypothetical protein